MIINGELGNGMSLKDFLSGLPGAITGLAALSFILTAVREWAYHISIGADFIILNSPTELASVALRWVPVIGVLIALSILIEMFTSRIEGFRSEEEIAEASSNPERTFFWRALPYRIALPMAIVGGLIKALYEDNPKALDWFLPLNGLWIIW